MSAGLKILPGNGHLALATILGVLFCIKVDSKMEYFSLCHQLDNVIGLNAIKSVQYVSSQQDREAVLLRGHRETLSFALVWWEFCGIDLWNEGNEEKEEK